MIWHSERCRREARPGHGLAWLHVAALFVLTRWSAPLLASETTADDPAGPPNGTPRFAIGEVIVDGQSQRPSTRPITSYPAAQRGPAPQPIQLSARAQRLDIHFGPGSAPTAVPTRLRYQLKGVDKHWHESGGQMRLNVTFLDSANNTVGAHDFFAEGESVGWAGSLAGTRFVQRSEQIIAPDRASQVQLELYSGGSEGTVGIMAIDELLLTVGGAAGTEPIRLFDSRTAEGRDLNLPLGIPRGWARDGSSPSIAQVLKLNNEEPRYLLTIVDGDPMRWGAWRTRPDQIIPVKPKETLTIQWREAYSIGWGIAAIATYSYLAPGDYLFELRSVNESGEWTDQTLSLPIIVVPPFWQQTWFRALALTLTFALLLTVVRHFTRRKMQLRLQILERQRAVEQERTRIARDIHDDLGANLTQIALLSELAQTDMDDPTQAKTHLRQIFSSARAMIRQLDEIVWAVDPTNDSLEETTSYLCKFAQDFFRTTGIRCRLDVPDTSPRQTFSSAERHNLFLVAKEAFNNIVKHAEATEVWLRVRNEQRALVVEIEDNGKGFQEGDNADPPQMGGHGSQNMRKRMAQIGARLEQLSTPGKGTLVRLTVPMRTAGPA